MNTKLLELINTDGEHHPMGPSAAERWMVCPASVRDTAWMPEESSDAAIEGTAAHTLAEIALSENIDTDAVDGYDDEMREYVQKYVQYVRDVAGHNKIFVEKRLDLSSIMPRGRGTADAIVIDPETDTLHIIDLKYGKGIEVSAENNKQLQIYAIGALEKVEKQFHISNIALHIIQPRLGNYSKWEISKPDLMVFKEAATVAANLCLQDDSPYNPDDKACQWCKAKGTCKALYNHSLEVVGRDFNPLAPAEMTKEQLLLVIENKSLIEKWLRAVEAHVYSDIDHGAEYPGYKLVEGRTVRKWSNDASDKLIQLLGDEAYEKKLIGITQAEKLIGKKQLSELGITVRPAGKPTLVKETDKRPALTKIEDDFDKI
jgi:RecB family exonuclease